MIQDILRSLLGITSRIGVNEDDSAELRLQKTLLTAISSMIMIASVLWIAIYLSFNEVLAASIPALYVVVSLISLVVFGRTGRFGVYRFSQLFLILLLPFFVLIALGGFINSSAVVLWSFLCPLGALVFATPRQALRWFILYVILVIVSGVVGNYARSDNNLPSTLVTIFFVMNIATISGIAFVILLYFVTQKDSAFQLLNVEQQKAENLLLNILPEEIAAILKNENRTIADHIEGATILFADVVGFTPLSASMTAVEVVELLNEVFSYFDTLAEKYNLEKIKTIGDAYMVAAGVPRPRPDHAQAIARMALEMACYTSPQGSKPIDFRIGINSGSVVAGVIGRKKFIYDLWGDAVNTASRMESHGSGGKIQITRETYELIKDDFICEPQGTIMVKGKGEMEVWHLIGEKAAL